MKLADLRIRNFRGIRSLDLQLGGKSTAILGPNGTGKSSVVDALDFLFTGGVGRLGGEGTGGVSLEKHGPHIDAPAEESWVEGVFITTTGQRVVLRRVVAAAERLEGLDAAPGEVTRYLEFASRGGHHLLTRRDILRYILAEPKKRNEQVAAVLQLKGVDSLRLEIQGAYKLARDSVSNAIAVRGATARTVLQSFSPPALDVEDALLRTNAHRASFGGGSVVLTAAEVRRDLRPPIEGQPHPLQSAQTKALLTQLMAWCSVTGASVQARADQYAADVAELHADTGAFKTLRASDLLHRGLALIEASECPLCLQSWDPEALRAMVTSRIEMARETDQRRARLEGERAGLRKELADVGATARGALTALRGIVGCDVGAVERFAEGLLEADKLLIDPVAGTLLGGDQRVAALEAFVPAAAADCVDALLQQAAALPSLDGIQKQWDELTAIERALAAHESALREVADAERVSSELEVADQYFLRARDEVLSDIYDAISDRFSALYARVHNTDEAEFRAAIAPTRAGLKLGVSFHDRGDFPPTAMHSEGHQDSMGVCLFLTLTAHIANGHVPIVILDDVVMSVDAGHRRALAAMLREMFPETQFIITTHDFVWWQQLRAVGLVSGKNRLEIHSWTLEDGPLLQIDGGAELAGARRALEAGRVEDAALGLRRAVEALFAEICDALGARVRYRANGRHGPADLLQPAIGRYNALFAKAKAAALSWGEGPTEWTAAEERRSAAMQGHNAEEWAVNATVHFSAKFASMTPADLAPVLESYERLISLFMCERCSGLYCLRESGTTELGVGCPCGAVNWTFQQARPSRARRESTGGSGARGGEAVATE